MKGDTFPVGLTGKGREGRLVVFRIFFQVALYNIWYIVIAGSFFRSFSEKKCKKRLERFVLMKKLHIFAPAFKEKHVP